MGDAIKHLYSQLILRDILSFITPGAIVVGTATFVFYPSIPYDKFHWLLYIPIFGLCYIVGYALQCFGELVGIIRFTPYSEKIAVNGGERSAATSIRIIKSLKNLICGGGKKKRKFQSSLQRQRGRKG